MLTRATYFRRLNVDDDNTTDVGRPYKQSALDESWDAIVIGSGIGGLTAAALLARHAGKRVLVLERHYTAGGFTHTFRRPGYEWDVVVPRTSKGGAVLEMEVGPLRSAYSGGSQTAGCC